jgi:uncharacterized protein YbjT (DUF2867 family)
LFFTCRIPSKIYIIYPTGKRIPNQKNKIYMKVLIIGANGKIGRILSEKLRATENFTPVAVIRNEGQKEYFSSRDIETKLMDLESSVDELKKAMQGSDTIVFTAGSSAKTGPDKTLTVDLDGAVKSMEAAKDVGIKRYIMVSALRTDDREQWGNSPIKPYLVAKHYADRILKSIGLDYTILRPGRLLDDEGTGKITVENPGKQKGVPREDVADVALLALTHDQTIGKVIEFNSGDKMIEEVLKGV